MKKVWMTAAAVLAAGGITAAYLWRRNRANRTEIDNTDHVVKFPKHRTNAFAKAKEFAHHNAMA